MSRESKPAQLALPRPGFALPISVPILFLIFVFLIGGGSRSDIASLPLLRGTAVLFAFWAAIGATREQWARIRTPLLLLAALTLWMAIQLVPLPPGVWQSLPGRETIVEIDRLLGLGDIWRPVSLTPSLTWNSLLGMTVPIAAVLLAMRLKPEDYPQLMLAIVIIACVSALLGLIQILSGIGSGVYPYRITNSGMMVGLFANRNHHALFQACAVLIAAMMLRDELMRKRQRKQMMLFLGFAFVLLTAMTVLIGSRAGFVAGVLAFTVGYAMIVPAWRDRAQANGRARPSASPTWASQLLKYSPPLLLAALLATVLQFSARTTSLNRVIDQSAVEDLRAHAWPTVRKMVETYWTSGSGFGSFPDVFKIFEPDALLRPMYFNRAHNDWVEAIISGGLPFALIILATLFWLGQKIVQQDRRHLIKGYRGDHRLVMMTVLLLLAAASLVDYPLRVPSIQAMAIILVTIFYCNTTAPMRRD